MATITNFEELEIWQLARKQCADFIRIAGETPLGENYELRSQMDRSSGSVMDCIAEGFERSGNAEFKNMLVIAKGSNGEYRSQLHRCLDRQHFSKEEFEILYSNNTLLGNKIMAFIKYLQNSPYKGQRYKMGTATPQT